MSRAKTSHRIRRAKNARTGNQILLRKIDAAFGRAAVRVMGERIERYQDQIRSYIQAQRDFGRALYKMAHHFAQVAQQIRTGWGAAQ